MNGTRFSKDIKPKKEGYLFVISGLGGLEGKTLERGSARARSRSAGKMDRDEPLSRRKR